MPANAPVPSSRVKGQRRTSPPQNRIALRSQAPSDTSAAPNTATEAPANTPDPDPLVELTEDELSGLQADLDAEWSFEYKDGKGIPAHMKADPRRLELLRRKKQHEETDRNDYVRRSRLVKKIDDLRRQLWTG